MTVQVDGLGNSAAQFVSSRRAMLIGGDWVDRGNDTLVVEDPSTSREVATVALAGSVEVDQAVTSARQAFDESSWRWMPGAARSRILHRIADLVEESNEQLAELDSLDAGIPISTSRALVEFAVDVMRYIAGLPTRIEGSTLVPASQSGEHFLSHVVREPLGVIGQIIPWNTPLAAALVKVGPALATGNTVVLKPAELTPLTALRLGEIALEAGVPAGVLNVVPGYGHIAGAALVADPRVDKVTFTGSTEVGKKIVAAAAANLTKVSLELGGKSPNIVFADADLDDAVAGAASAIFEYAGQSCVAGSRLFVEAPIFDQFVAALSERASAMVIGPALDPATQLGPLISAKHRDRVLGYVEAGLDEGSKAACGGRRQQGSGFFLEPTILTGTTPAMAVEREEIFGPVVAAIPFSTQEEVTKRANDTAYGLAAGVWTRDHKKAQQMIRDLRAGVVWVNCYNMFDAALPFGGYKRSGWGRESGAADIELYTQTKSVTSQF